MLATITTSYVIVLFTALNLWLSSSVQLLWHWKGDNSIIMWLTTITAVDAGAAL